MSAHKIQHRYKLFFLAIRRTLILPSQPTLCWTWKTANKKYYQAGVVQ